MLTHDCWFLQYRFVHKLAALAVVEPVHPREPPTGWTPAQQVHLPTLEDPLPPVVGLAPLDGLPEEQVAVVAEDGAVWVVELVSLGWAAGSNISMAHLLSAIPASWRTWLKLGLLGLSENQVH